MNLSSSKRIKLVWGTVLLLSLVLVCIPRFNRWDLGYALTPGGKPATEVLGDASQYIAFVEVFRDDEPEVQLRAPFAYRPLVPLIASLLPFDPMTAINITNLLGLIIALLYLYKILSLLNITFPMRILGCGLFVFSFPTFYYGTIGYIDPVMMGFLTLSTFLILSERWIPLVFVLALGALTKESILIILPVLVASVIISRKSLSMKLVLISSSFIAVLLGLYIARELSPVTSNYYIWTPDVKYFLNNVSRPRSWLSFALSFGIPGFISILILLIRREAVVRELIPLVIGLFFSIVYFLYALFSAYADGRFIWPSVIFSIPIAMFLLSASYNHKKIT